MAPRWLSACLMPLIFGNFGSHVTAQYSQETNVGFIQHPNGQPNQFLAVDQWRAHPTGAAPERVIDIAPELVVLEYNCYYMRDICKNADNWYASPRGQDHKRRNGNRFTYDFNTGKTSAFRNDRRRAASCGGFKNRVTCPHSDQNVVMRHNGAWWHKDLEPGTTINEIKAFTLGTVRIPSEVCYTCDEFPPATWIEGGSGISSSTYEQSETRCAAFRCDRTRGVKAEQNWQATAHNALQSSLKAVIRRRNAQTGNAEFNWYRAKGSVVFFEFRYDMRSTKINGNAANVYTYSSRGNPLPAVDKPIKQAKRDLMAQQETSNITMSPEQIDREAFWRWADNVTVDELLALGPAYVSEQYILANHTEAEMDMGFPGTGMSMPWMSTDFDDDGDEEEERPLPDIISGPPRADPNKIKKRQTLDDSRNVTTSGNSTVTATDLERARELVEKAFREAGELNAARFANPARNDYRLKPGTMIGASGSFRKFGTFSNPSEQPPPLLEITDELASAAAIVSEAEAVVGNNISWAHFSKRKESPIRRQVQAAATGTFWMEHISRHGTVPFGDDPNYKVFRNVVDFGAKGDGVADDTKAIKDAMNSGGRCGEKCNGSTTKNAIVYFPPGTYRVSSTIQLPFGTQVIGDANNPPTLVAARIFIGIAVLSANAYTGGGTGIDGRDQQWYVNTANFYRQIRNIKIDITQIRATQQVAGLHYQIAQATSLQNVELIASPGTQQRGIFAENGSGGVISDVTFRGGKFGIYGGNQQFTAQRLNFIGCETGVQVIWDWGWVWKSITMTDVGVGFSLLQEGKTATGANKRQTTGAPNGNIGSASFIDSIFRNVQTAVLIAPPNNKPGSGSTGVILDNVEFQGVGKAVVDTTGATLLAAPSGKVEHWALGPVYQEQGRDFSIGGKVGTFRRQPDLLDKNGAYFERAKPQYEGRPVGDFVHVKDFGARGDGVTDDTAAFQRALYESQGRILFVDSGSYIITGTVTVPINSRIVGETWSQLVASGSYFSDAQNPKVMLQVGSDGVVGDIEMQDLIFTNRGPTEGLIFVEWNVRALTPGSAGLWDCHVRVGGATGTDLTPAECPALTSGVAQGCNAGSLMMHITPRASGYFENMWLWVADHMIDDPDLSDANNTMVQNSVYVARGLLIESKSPTWLYGTSSEHAVYYQYNFHKAQNIFAGMIQTESPYYQPTPNPPAPFESAVGKLPGDPDYSCKSGDEFSGCDESWAVIMRECANTFIAGAGLYSWFSTYTQDCIDGQTCQKALMLLENNHAGVRFHHLITIGAKYMAVMDGKGITALDYLNVESHPRWSQISVLDVSNDGGNAELLWIDPKIWDMDQPSFTCVPPCLVNLPPWTSATRIVEYPRITVSSGDWATTITRAPITITQMHFEVVTLTAGGGVARNKKRTAQPFADFWPKPATTPRWPMVTYTDPNGEIRETAPAAPFPPPPQNIGPDAPAPTAGGSWPKKAIAPRAGSIDNPMVRKCFWNGSWTDCDNGGWGGDWEFGEMEDAPNAPNDEDYGEADTICPNRIRCRCDRIAARDDDCLPNPDCATETTSTPTTTKEPEKPTETALEEGRPMDNRPPNCYNSGQKAVNAQMSNTARSFCRSLGEEGTVIRNPMVGSSGKDLVRSQNYELPANGQWPIHIYAEMVIKPNCQFTVNTGYCQRYFSVITDSCNCKGADGKQGGHFENRCYKFRLDPNTFS